MASSTFIISMLLPLLFHFGESQLQLNHYSKSCPRAEKIIKQEVNKLYREDGDTAISSIRNLFLDCIIQGCDASVLLDNGLESDKTTEANYGVTNFNYVNTIKKALENECPSTVSCADIIALSARDSIDLLGGPQIELKTGRRDSKINFARVVRRFVPNQNDSIEKILARFKSIGIDAEGTVALLGAHSIGRIHCSNLVNRLYPTVDPNLDPEFAVYLKGQCPTPNPEPKAVFYSRDAGSGVNGKPKLQIDNNYYKNLLKNRGLLVADQELTSTPTTLVFVEKMAADNGYFNQQFARAARILSENNVLTEEQGEVRTDCRYANKRN